MDKSIFYKIGTLITVIGVEAGNADINIEKARYHKIIYDDAMLTEVKRTLLLTFF